jgi:hypothetical protein
MSNELSSMTPQLNCPCMAPSETLWLHGGCQSLRRIR